MHQLTDSAGYLQLWLLDARKYCQFAREMMVKCVFCLTYVKGKNGRMTVDTDKSYPCIEVQAGPAKISRIFYASFFMGFTQILEKNCVNNNNTTT